VSPMAHAANMAYSSPFFFVSSATAAKAIELRAWIADQVRNDGHFHASGWLSIHGSLLVRSQVSGEFSVRLFGAFRLKVIPWVASLGLFDFGR